jgi:MOSC domain-containing protein YiiM
MTESIVRAVLCGAVKPLGATTSGIDKLPVQGPMGLEGDAQADLRVHGGTDKAVHCYAWRHYATWHSELPHQSLFERPGAFGENLSIDGLDESTVCLADRWQIGTAQFVVTQGRQPCFKLNLRFAQRDMARRVQDSLRAGWYLRVAVPGMVSAGDPLELLDRPQPAWSIERLLALIRDRHTHPDVLAEVLRAPLTPSWHHLFAQRLASRSVESWERRLSGV